MSEPATMTVEWTPCSEAEPSETKLYMVTVDEIVRPRRTTLMVFYIESGWAFCGVVAWALKPEPWELEKSELFVTDRPWINRQ